MLIGISPHGQTLKFAPHSRTLRKFGKSHISPHGQTPLKFGKPHESLVTRECVLRVLLIEIYKLMESLLPGYA